LKAAGFEIERMFTFNRISVPGWWFNGKILRRRHFGKVQLKLFDSTVLFWRLVDRFLPWQGLSLIAIGRRTGGSPGEKGKTMDTRYPISSPLSSAGKWKNRLTRTATRTVDEREDVDPAPAFRQAWTGKEVCSRCS